MLVYLLVLNLEVEMAAEPVIERRLLNITSSFQLNKKTQKHVLNLTEKKMYTALVICCALISLPSTHATKIL